MGSSQHGRLVGHDFFLNEHETQSDQLCFNINVYLEFCSYYFDLRQALDRCILVMPVIKIAKIKSRLVLKTCMFVFCSKRCGGYNRSWIE